MIKRWFWLLVLILIGLRGWYAWKVAPPSLNQDEAAILMNARFLAETGHDEWEKSWPIVFRSFGDAKLPVYIYTVMGVGRLTGWNMMSVRLPSFMAGIGVTILVFLLAKRWFKSEQAGQWAAIFLLISPWVWHYSSIGFEAHFGLMLFLLALYWWTGSRRWWFDAAAGLALSASILTYNAPLLIAPWIVLLLWQQRRWRWSFWRGVLCFAVGLGVAAALTLPASAQKGSISIFQDPTLVAFYPQYRESFAGLLQKLLGNRFVYWSIQMVKNLVNSFSWDFLVQKGGANPWHGIPYTGHLAFIVWLSGPLAIGRLFRQIWQSWRRRSWPNLSASLVLLIGLPMSLLPALITVDAPHATRSLFFFVLFTILAAGFWQLVWKQSGVASRWLLGVLVLISWLVWWILAPLHWRQGISARWQVGLMPALLSPEAQRAPSVLVLDDIGTLYPYAVLADSMPATLFWRTVHRSLPDTVGLVKVEAAGKYRFWPENNGQSVVVVRPQSPTKWVTIKKE